MRISSFFTDKNGKLVLFQVPNPPIIIWGSATVLKRFSDGAVFSLLDITAFVALILWAGLELFMGDSYFRRALGLVVGAIAIANKIL